IPGYLNVIFTAEHKKEILRYTYDHQNEDGGLGLHITGLSMMFTTFLNYRTTPILGDGPMVVPTILHHGEKLGWWCYNILGVYDWEGSNPMPPEFWTRSTLLPSHPRKHSFLPHPSFLLLKLNSYKSSNWYYLTSAAKMFSYSRLTYPPMSYFYATRFVGPITPLVEELRQEIYCEINRPKEDNYYPHGPVQRFMWDSFYNIAEPLLKRWTFNKIRDNAIQFTNDQFHYEDETSCYITIGCAENPLRMLACWA
ncbi:hypothetical protein DVH24_000584, partial [Malus domestica]